jgi:serine phosphatase RsbU (regulator of sigma subunit)
MKPTLRVLAGLRIGEGIELGTGAEFTVGRDPTCGLLVSGEKVSRIHAQFRFADGVLTVENRSKVNGIYVNGTRRESAELKHWDTVVIGATVLRVEETGETLGNEHALYACLLEISRLLSGGGERVAERSLEALFLALPVTRLAMFTIDEAGEPVQGPTSIRGGGTPERMSHSFARQVLKAGQAILLEANASSGIIPAVHWGKTLQDQSVRTVLGVPIQVKGRTAAVLLGDNLEQPGILDRTHLQVMEWAARALEHVFQRDELHRLEQDRMRAEYELEAGRSVQRHLLTRDPSSLPGPWRWAATYRPALVLGGDFYGFHASPDGRATWIVADVSGKGIPAALVASMIKVAVCAVHRSGAGPRELILGVHSLIIGEIPNAMFFTAFALRAAPDGWLEWAGVGHPAGVLLRASGGRERLESDPGMLGNHTNLDLHGSIREQRTRASPGDRVCLLTDGVTEAMDPDGNLFGEDLAEHTLVAQAAAPLEGAVAGLIAAIGSHCKTPHFNDDVTVVMGSYT